MRRAYFASDGNYGDARGLVVVDVFGLSGETWDYLDELTDSHRHAVAVAMFEAQANPSAPARDTGTADPWGRLFELVPSAERHALIGETGAASVSPEFARALVTALSPCEGCDSPAGEDCAPDCLGVTA